MQKIVYWSQISHAFIDWINGRRSFASLDLLPALRGIFIGSAVRHCQCTYSRNDFISVLAFECICYLQPSFCLGSDSQLIQ